MAQELFEFAQLHQRRYSFDPEDSTFWYGVNHDYKEEVVSSEAGSARY